MEWLHGFTLSVTTALWLTRLKKPLGGFTLVELLVVLCVVAALTTMVVPSLRSFVQEQRMTTQANEVLTVLASARNSALHRQVRVTLCASYDQQTCHHTSFWETGWVLFTDTGVRGQLDGSDQILGSGGQLSGNSTLRAGGTFRYYVSYLPNGMSQGSGGLANDTLRLCDARGREYARSIIINVTGRVRIRKGASQCP